MFGYSDTPCLEDVNVHILSGEFVAITGPNGASKTTMLKLLLGLLKPWRGSIKLNGKGLEIASDPACPRVKGDGTFRALNNTVSSGPSDSWVSPDGAYLYQIYANASKLIGYRTQPDGSLEEVTSATIPYQSPQGLVGV